MYVQIIKKIFLADSSELMGVRLISASGAQKRFIPSLQTSCTSNSWEIFFFPIRANRCVLDSFSPPEPKNVWFLLYRHHVRRVHQKFFLADSSEVMGIRLISASWAQKSLIPILYKSCTSNSWIHVRQKNFLAHSSERMGVRLITVSWAPKRLIPTF